jgi:hypothetical protein
MPGGLTAREFLVFIHYLSFANDRVLHSHYRLERPYASPLRDFRGKCFIRYFLRACSIELSPYVLRLTYS